MSSTTEQEIRKPGQARFPPFTKDMSVMEMINTSCKLTKLDETNFVNAYATWAMWSEGQIRDYLLEFKKKHDLHARTLSTLCANLTAATKANERLDAQEYLNATVLMQELYDDLKKTIEKVQNESACYSTMLILEKTLISNGYQPGEIIEDSDDEQQEGDEEQELPKKRARKRKTPS